MKIKQSFFQASGIAVLTLVLAIPGITHAAKRIVFGGGPATGGQQLASNHGRH